MKKQTDQKQPAGAGVTRRQVVKGAGAAGAVGALGLFGGKAPAVAQQRQLHVVAWSHFISPADEWMRNTFAPEFRSATGVRLQYETINANDLPARGTSATESGQGPDVFQFQWNQPYLYASGCINHNDLAEELGVDSYYDFIQDDARVDGVFRGIPFGIVGNGNVYRQDIFQEVGFTDRDGNAKRPETWEEYLDVGRRLKQFGMPVGQTLGHTFGDAPTFAYPLLWSFGGMEVDENQKVAIDSTETRFACSFLRDFWNEACDEGGLAWDDSSNNRAFFAETIASTLNGASIYFVARNQPDMGPPGLVDKLDHFLNPLGPNGRYHLVLPFHHSIMRYSEQQGAAKDYIRMLMQDETLEQYLKLQDGYTLGPDPKWEDHPFWDDLPDALQVYRSNAAYGRNVGYAGPPDRRASEAQARYIVVDLFARVARGDSVESSIRQAANELRGVYEG